MAPPAQQVPQRLQCGCGQERAPAAPAEGPAGRRCCCWRRERRRRAGAADLAHPRFQTRSGEAGGLAVLTDCTTSLAPWRVAELHVRGRCVIAAGGRLRGGAGVADQATAWVQEEVQKGVGACPKPRASRKHCRVRPRCADCNAGCPLTWQGFGGSSSGSAGSGVSRFSIELPLPGESAAELAALASDVLRRLPPAAAAGAAVVFGSDADAAAAAPALPRGACVLSLQSACRSDSLAGPLLLVAPGVADVSSRRRVTAAVGGHAPAAMPAACAA